MAEWNLCHSLTTLCKCLTKKYCNNWFFDSNIFIPINSTCTKTTIPYIKGSRKELVKICALTAFSVTKLFFWGKKSCKMYLPHVRTLKNLFNTVLRKMEWFAPLKLMHCMFYITAAVHMINSRRSRNGNNASSNQAVDMAPIYAYASGKCGTNDRSMKSLRDFPSGPCSDTIMIEIPIMKHTRWKPWKLGHLNYITPIVLKWTREVLKCGSTSKRCRQNRKQCRPWSDCSFWSRFALFVPIFRLSWYANKLIPNCHQTGHL